MRTTLINRRKELGLSQVDVARKLGVDKSHYCNIEKGKRGISLDIAYQLSKILKVKFAYENFLNEE